MAMGRTRVEMWENEGRRMHMPRYSCCCSANRIAERVISADSSERTLTGYMLSGCVRVLPAILVFAYFSMHALETVSNAVLSFLLQFSFLRHFVLFCIVLSLCFVPVHNQLFPLFGKKF